MYFKRDRIILFFKGFAMGLADIVPGVSGGTVALITGVYSRLLAAVSAVDKEFVHLLLNRKFLAALNHIDIKFLLPLGAGIVFAILSMARVMHFFMSEYSIFTWSLFFGLIVASIFYVSKEIKNIVSVKAMMTIIVGTIIGYLTVVLIPVETSNDYISVFLAGAIAICAMILPGISGSFILLILGKYLYITSAIKNPFVDQNLLLILVFCCGCFVGLISFSKLLNYLLAKFHNITMCLLLGFMIGSLRKIWPWKEVIEQKIIRGKVHVLQDLVIFPTEFNLEVIIAFAIMIFGVVLVLFLERIGNKSGVSSAG